MQKRAKRSGKQNAYQQYQDQDVVDFGSYKNRNNVEILPKNVRQEDYLLLLSDKNKNIVLATGPAGTGKTWMAVLAAIKALKAKECRKIVITRPAVSVDEEHGFLPGPQPLDASVLTPTGWTTMGELKVGDRVIAKDGSHATVMEIFPKGEKEIFRITTDCGKSTEACGDHLWYTETFEDRKRKRKGSVKTTKTIMNSLETTKHVGNGQKRTTLNHYIPRNDAVEYDERELPMSPYVLGYLLGDGHMGNGGVSVAVQDSDAVYILPKISQELYGLGSHILAPHDIGYAIGSKCTHDKVAKPVKITDMQSGSETVYSTISEASKALGVNRTTLNSRCVHKRVIDGMTFEFLENSDKWTNPIKNALDQLGLLGKIHHEKFIPELYLYGSSITQRLELLRGLMDSDGTVKSNGNASFTTTSEQLALDIQTLVNSLGGRCNIRSRDRRSNKKNGYILGREVVHRLVSYEFDVSMPHDMNPFFLPRKAERHRAAYMHGIRIKSIESVGVKEAQCILIDHPDHLYITDDFIVTHNTLVDKMAPWTRPIFDVFEEYYSPVEIQNMIEMGIIEVSPLAFMRGRSFKDSFIIADETQNTTREQMKMLLTRIGSGSKIVVTGDLAQHDRGYGENGLDHFISLFKESHDSDSRIGIVEFDKKHVERHPVVSVVLGLYGEK